MEEREVAMMIATKTATTDTVMLMLPGRTAAQPLGTASQPSRRDRGTGRMRLTVRGRIVLLVLTALVSWLGWSTFSIEPAYSETGAMQVVTYTVSPGDTLWSYAADVTPVNGDVSQRVDEIMELNHLDSPVLQPGQVIVVPAQWN